MTEEELKKIKEEYPEYTKKGRNKNLTNIKFGNLLALYRYDEQGASGKCAKWVCLCDCGNIKICDAGRLNSGSLTNCGCRTKELQRIARKNSFKDLTGKQFGELTVLMHIDNPNNTGALFKCKCSCGQERIVKGTALSAGQVQRCEQCVESLKHKTKGSSLNLIGQKYGKLTVLEETLLRDNSGSVKWKCLCDCGNITYIPTNSLTSGNSTTCGASIHKAKDWTGKKFGLLTAIQIINKQDNQGHFYWKCKCECGNFIETSSHSLVTGRSQSCGCEKSRNERKITEMLNILYPNSFIGQKIFNDDILGRKAFDFYINNQYIIEYDGIQHFQYKNNNGWNNKENFEKKRERDLIKNKYYFDNNIPLIRIPYNAEYTIDDLKLETTRFLLTPENEEEYYNSRGVENVNNNSRIYDEYGTARPGIIEKTGFEMEN